MTFLGKTREVFRVLNEARKILPFVNVKQADDDTLTSLGAVFEDTVAKYADNTLLIFEGREWTYGEFDRDVNRLAHFLKAAGVKRGDTIALLMENRPAFVQVLLAAAKLGASAGLLNNSLTGTQLRHCIDAIDAGFCIVGAERADALAGILDDLSFASRDTIFWMRDGDTDTAPDWAGDATAALAGQPDTPLPETREVKAGEVCCYIYTSGTTGLPKASIQRHRRILAAGQVLGQVGFRTTPADRLYLCLPIYHATGLMAGLCHFLLSGGSIFLRRNFSASQFWPEVQQHATTSFIYVGELCRYLFAQDPCPEEKNNPLRTMMGNGLRPDIWDEFKTRFGIERISEIYGASEGSVTFVNIFNKPSTIGAPLMKVRVVKYDTERDEIIRNNQGMCITAAPDEPGLLLGGIDARAQFDGYTDKNASEAKIVTDVEKSDDRWFNTGDLVRRIDVGFALGLPHYQFVDRVGDTFRWRAENVSTNEVGEILNTHPQIDIANVYGVEVAGAEGRAGMVAFTFTGDAFDWRAFETLVEAQLPSFARPVFVRLQHDTATTVTFKLLKGDLREQAYHLDRVGGDPIFVKMPQSAHYEPLTEAHYKAITEAKAGF